MKKATVLFLILIASTAIYSQSKINFKGKEVYFVYNDPTTFKIVNKIPVGNNVKLEYDTFFKSWYIRYSDQNGLEKPFKLSYIMHNKEGRYTLMEDTFKHKYEVTNDIETDGTLSLIQTETVKGMIFSVLIEGVSQ